MDEPQAQPIWRRIVSKGVENWAVGAVGLLIAALVTFAWQADIGDASLAQRWYNLRHPLPAPAKPGEYVVLLANLDGDDSAGTQSRRLAEALDQEFGSVGGSTFLTVQHFPRPLTLAGSAPLSEARAKAEAEGHA